jgi:hypothetical protein
MKGQRPAHQKGAKKRPNAAIFSLLSPHLKEIGTDCRLPASPMNNLEQSFAQHLEARRRAGTLQSWGFERIKLRLADNTWWTPDFDYLLPDGQIVIVDTKGHWEEAARIKIKTCASLYPHFRFQAVTKQTKREGGGFKVEAIKSHHWTLQQEERP